MGARRQRPRPVAAGGDRPLAGPARRYRLCLGGGGVPHVAGIRKHLRHELGLPATAYKSVGYWIENGERWREQYDALDPEIRAQLEAMWDQPRDEEEIEDEYEDRLTELGL